MRQQECFHRLLSLGQIPSLPKWEEGKTAVEWAAGTKYREGYLKALVDMGATPDIIGKLEEEQ